MTGVRGRPWLSLSRRSFWIGLAAGVGLSLVLREIPYINWEPVVPPVDGPLVIRHDAKGDGRFAAPRSGNRKHRGIDVAAELGSAVRAIRSGAVLETGTHRGLGRFVKLEHNGGMTSLYAHLKDVTIEAGDRVGQGQPIGTVGKTGNARHPWITPHVHLEVVKDGDAVNPASLGLAVAEPEPFRGEVDASGGE